MSSSELTPGLVQLIWFVRVVEAGSFAEAARRAGTTASAMSKAIGRFEQTHGLRLLNRTTHSLSLTEEGERLLDEGRILSESLERAESCIAQVGNSGAVGRVRISAPTPLARELIIPHLPRFMEQHPDIKLELQFSENLVDLAENGIDIAIRSAGLNGLPGHIARPLCDIARICCASADYLERHGAPQAPVDLRSHKQIAFRNKASGKIDAWEFVSPANGERISHAPQGSHVFDDGHAIWSMICAGMGVGWTPYLGFEDVRSGRVLEILREWRIPAVPLSIVRLDRRYVPERAKIVMNFIIELASSWQPRNE